MVKKEELDKLLEVKGDIEKITTISSDGKNLLTRLPIDIVKELKIKKGNKIRWFVDVKNKKISLNLENGS